MKNVIFVLIMILTSFGIRYTAEYPFFQVIFAMIWCVSGFLLLYNFLLHITKK